MSVNRVPQVTDSGDCAGSKAPFVGPLTPHLEGFAVHLGAEGYTNSVLRTKCALARGGRHLPRLAQSPIGRPGASRQPSAIYWKIDTRNRGRIV